MYNLMVPKFLSWVESQRGESFNAVKMHAPTTASSYSRRLSIIIIYDFSGVGGSRHRSTSHNYPVYSL